MRGRHTRPRRRWSTKIQTEARDSKKEKKIRVVTQAKKQFFLDGKETVEYMHYCKRTNKKE
jgi:uncharacterized metal-binding protein YceD (DUF177 family)